MTKRDGIYTMRFKGQAKLYKERKPFCKIRNKGIVDSSSMGGSYFRTATPRFARKNPREGENGATATNRGADFPWVREAKIQPTKQKRLLIVPRTVNLNLNR